MSTNNFKFFQENITFIINFCQYTEAIGSGSSSLWVFAEMGKETAPHSFSAVNDPFAHQSLPLAFVSRGSDPLSPGVFVIRRNTRSRPRSDVVARILLSRDFILILKRFLICQLAFFTNIPAIIVTHQAGILELMTRPEGDPIILHFLSAFFLLHPREN